MAWLNELKDRITRRDYTVGIVGAGYAGLPLALAFAEAGFPVIAFDIDAAKVERLNAGATYIRSISAERIGGLVRQGRLRATNDMTGLGKPDAILACIPTPLNRSREPDLQFVEKTTAAIAERLRPGQLVCLESTTYPGTTEELLLPTLSAGGLVVGRDFWLAFSPEREDPGNANYTTARIPKVVGGMTPACQELAGHLYAQVMEKVILVSSPRVAEATKILENVYRAVNIALVNELKVAFEKMGLDIWEVIEAAKTKPFGFQAFYPGPGLGGHCIPIDPFYLTWKARQYDVATRFIELAGEINSAMPEHVVQRLTDALNARGKALKGAKILIMGLAYKKDVDDPRESPAFKILTLLMPKGVLADYSDPYFPHMPAMRNYHFRADSVELTPDAVRGYDAVVLVTDHSTFPYAAVHESASLIIDTRNAFGQRGLAGAHVVRA
jgi:UDP-N-acetyl-D-glucosamine dehydrogenase